MPHNPNRVVVPQPVKEGTEAPIDFKTAGEMVPQIPVEKIDSTTVTVEPTKATPVNQVKEPVLDTNVQNFGDETVASVVASDLDIENMTEADFINSPLYEARPLGYADTTIAFTEIRKEYKYRLVNKLALNGANYAKALAMGFVNASTEDVEVKNPAFICNGVITYGDVILMKMPKLQYYGHLKANHMRSEVGTTRKALNKRGLEEGERTIRSLGGPLDELRRKVGVYVPPIGDMTSIIKD